MRLSILLLAIWAGGCKSSGIDNPNTSPTPTTHQQYFPIASGAHAGIDCNTCHGSFDSFTQFDCLTGCHAQADTDPGHSGVNGYVYASANCYGCHPTGVGVNHNDFFPIGPGTKHDLACTTCHTNPTDKKVFDCLSGGCHSQKETDSNHTDVGGYMYLSANCYGCHFRGQK